MSASGAPRPISQARMRATRSGSFIRRRMPSVTERGATGTAGRPLGRTAVLIPVKAFGAAKRRLSPALAPSERSRLAKDMADHVLRAAHPLPVAVVCDDAEVADWARQGGALVITEPGRGLNGAVAEGVRQLAAAGVEQVIVAHADLPLARELSWVAGFEGVTVVPDR